MSTTTADTEPLRGELDRVHAAPDQKTVLDLLDRMKPEIEKALPRSIGVERFTRTVLTEEHLRGDHGHHVAA